MNALPHLGVRFRRLGFFFSLLVPQILFPQSIIPLSTVFEQTSGSSMSQEFEISGAFWKYLLKTERLDSSGALKLTILDKDETAILQINSQKDDVRNISGVFFTKGKHVAFVEAKGYEWHLSVLESPKQEGNATHRPHDGPLVASSNEFVFGFLFTIVGGTLILVGAPHQEQVSVNGDVITVTKEDKDMQTVGYILGGTGILIIGIAAFDK